VLDSNLNAFYMKPSDDIVSLETILKLNVTKICVFADDLFSNCLLPIFLPHMNIFVHMNGKNIFSKQNHEFLLSSSLSLLLVAFRFTASHRFIFYRHFRYHNVRDFLFRPFLIAHLLGNKSTM